MVAAALRRQGGHLLGRLVRLSSTASASQNSQQQTLVIPAEVAHLVSLRGGMTALPPDVTAAIESAAKGANRKAVKRRGQELSYRLRHMSRSKHRGGVHPNLSEQLAGEQRGAAAAEGAEASALAVQRQRRGKRRQSRAAAMEALTRTAALPVSDSRLPDADVQRMLGGQLAQLVTAEQRAQAAAEAEAVAARSSIAEGGALYDTPAALAYAAARLPACYAALHRALCEVAERRPAWRPVSQLDFGAGPGTAVWAAQQVWPQSALEALAVEPAGAMAWLGHEIHQRLQAQYEAAVAARAAATSAATAAPALHAGEQQQQQQRWMPGEGPGSGQGSGGAAAAASRAAAAGPEEEAGGMGGRRGEEGQGEGEPPLPAPPPRLRWMYKLPPRYRASQPRKRYDLVTAGYVLGELRSDSERRRLVEQLWEFTSPQGVLLLLEPGTPAGAAHIQRARTQLLELGASEAQAQQRAAAGAEAAAAAEAAEAGAHVVAPCPHDGACPLASRPAWCHFVQRFQRTQLQRAAKASAGIQPRTYQDERFSYVAIAKGPRPVAHAAAAQPAVAGSFVPSFEDPQEFLEVPAHLVPRKVPEGAAPLVMFSDGEEDEGDELGRWWDDADGKEREGDSSESESGSSSSDSDTDTDTDSHSSSAWESSSDSDSDSEGEADSSSGWESSSESLAEEGSEQTGKGGRVPASTGGRMPGLQLPTALAEAAAAAAAASDRHAAAGPAAAAAGVDEATRRLLLQSVLEGADEDEEEGISAELAARLEQELAAAVQQQQQEAAAAAAAAGTQGSEQGGEAGRLGPWVLAPMAQHTIDLLMAGERIQWELQEPAAVAAARAASGGWSRVIRTPRKRSGHVLLDLCSAAPAQAPAPQAPGPAPGGPVGGDPAGGPRQALQPQPQPQPQPQQGVLLRQVVSRAAARREAGGTAAYRLARRLRWGDLWPADYQGRFRSEEAPTGAGPGES